MNDTTCPKPSPTPDPEWLRGECPRCGGDLVSICRYVTGRGYLLVWECWGALLEQPTCSYRRTL